MTKKDIQDHQGQGCCLGGEALLLVGRQFFVGWYMLKKSIDCRLLYGFGGKEVLVEGGGVLLHCGGVT